VEIGGAMTARLLVGEVERRSCWCSRWRGRACLMDEVETGSCRPHNGF
jgi:hypothetical protein